MIDIDENKETEESSQYKMQFNQNKNAASIFFFIPLCDLDFFSHPSSINYDLWPWLCTIYAALLLSCEVLKIINKPCVHDYKFSTPQCRRNRKGRGSYQPLHILAGIEKKYSPSRCFKLLLTRAGIFIEFFFRYYWTSVLEIFSVFSNIEHSVFNIFGIQYQ